VRPGAQGHYETRSGQLYTLKPAPGSGVIVELSEASPVADPVNLAPTEPPP
jgi:hypothetical protein